MLLPPPRLPRMRQSPPPRRRAPRRKRRKRPPLPRQPSKIIGITPRPPRGGRGVFLCAVSEAMRIVARRQGLTRGGKEVTRAMGSLATYQVQSVDIAHLIQIALTPIFLISAIGVTLNVLTSRLARIVDRARAIEDVLRRSDHPAQDARDLHAVLGVLARRARFINAAITFITLSALFISLVVVMLFVNAFL